MGVLILFLVLVVLLIIAGSIAGLIAASRSARLEREVKRLKSYLKILSNNVGRLEEQLKQLARYRPPAEKPAAPEPTSEEKMKAPGLLVEIVEDDRPVAPEEVAPATPEEVKPEEKPEKKETEEPSATPPLPKPGESIAEAAKRLADWRREAAHPDLVAGIPLILRKPKEPVAAHEVRAKAKVPRDHEWWKKLEETAGKYWITWVGAIVLFLSLGLFVKYAFDHKWLGPTGRVILGIVTGIIVTAAGEHFIRRKMRPLGQSLVGAGLGILYVSLYAAYGIYELLPQSVTFGFMVLVTAGGMTLAIVHNAIAISTIAVLGGFLTPVMLRTGHDPRDSLFSYLLLLDLGVLVIAFFKRWKLLDMIAFVGTWVFFAFWYFKFYSTEAAAPATLWLCVFYFVFLLSPYVFHLRKVTPIAGERFFMAITNAAMAFGFAYTILHEPHKYTLGLITLSMSTSYLVLGSLTRRRIPEDVKAVFAFLAMSVTFLTIAVPILLDFNGVTVVWAAQAPLLLYIAYKYAYFPVRMGSIISLLLAAGRIFTIQWPLHEEAFTPVFNENFGSAIFVALAGGTFALIHHMHRKNATEYDRFFKIAVGITSGFLALTVIHIEVWQWLELSGREHLTRWASSLVWVAGAAGFLVAGMKLRSIHARCSGFLALVLVLVLEIWDYGLGINPDCLMFFNGRFLAALAGILVVFSYAIVYRHSQETCYEDEKLVSMPLYGIGILLAILLITFETWQWLDIRSYHYLGRCLLPLIWSVGTVGYLAAGIRLHSVVLRRLGLAVLSMAAILAAYGFARSMDSDYTLYLNGRFFGALTVILTAYAYGRTLRYFREISGHEGETTGVGVYGTAIMLLLILVSFETWQWLDIHEHFYFSRCILPVIWVAGTAGYLTAGIRLRSPAMRSMCFVTLVVAGSLAIRGYGAGMTGHYILYLNGRFLASLAVVLMAFSYGHIIRRYRDISKGSEQSAAWLLNGMTIVALFFLLSVETYLYCINTIDNPERANWVGQMSLSIVWGVYAAALLVIGFWRKVRAYRLSALGLFGLTALKLVIVDMAHIKEVYRIISFLVLGMLMIGVSYLYHRVEKWLEATAKKDSEPLDQKTEEDK